jgi:hypothetical protein
MRNMHEILRLLPAGVLDLGSRTGSFAADPERVTVRVDLEVPTEGLRTFVAARAESAPVPQWTVRGRDFESQSGAF